MKKKLSIQLRITLWYAALIAIICVLSLFMLFAVTQRAQYMHAKETLESATVVLIDELEIEHGMLEIDSDIDEIPNVYAALLDDGGGMIYGRRRVSLPLEDGIFRWTHAGGHSWYVLDTRLDVAQVGVVWLRVVMASGFSLGAMRAAALGGLWLLPLLALVALWGGYVLTRRALRPVKEMTQVAERIARGGDLSGRTMLAGYAQGADELHALAATLSEMLSRLQEAFERERQFTSDAAHELRTPLNAMRTQGEYALSRESLEEKDAAIERMLEKGEEMRQLVSQLLLIARLDAGQTPMEDDVELAALLCSVAEDMQIVAQERGISLETALESAHVRGNRAMLTRAAVNLVDNAIRYGHESGHVRVSVRQEGQEAVVCVEDDGPGIPAQSLPHVFERFWRGDSAHSGSGTGIGLAIVAAAAKAHGGSAHVRSEAGAGCRFEIRLPIQKEMKKS